MKDPGFDYQVLHRCEFELLDEHNESFSCGEPATHEVWWDDCGRNTMKVCQNHFNHIQRIEKPMINLGDAAP